MCVVVDRCTYVGLVLVVSWEGDFEAGKGTVYVSWYGYIYVISFVVPLQGHAEVEGSYSIDGGGLLRVESVVEVVMVDKEGGADSEVVDHKKCKGGGAC